MNIYADIFARGRVFLGMFAVVMSAFAGYGFSFLKIDDVPRKLFAAQDEDFERLETLFRDFGSDDNDCVVVLESDQLFTSTGSRVIREIALRSRAIEGIISVQSLADVSVFPNRGFPHSLMPLENAPASAFVQARKDALEHPLVQGQLLSPDGKMALLLARISGDIESIEGVRPIVEKIRDIVREETEGTGIRGSITGIPALRTEVIQSLRRIQLRYTVLGVAIGFIVGIFVFRRPGAVLIVTLPAFVGVFWMLGFLGLFGEKLNVVNSVMPPMILVIAFTDSVHLLSAVRDARQQGMNRIESCQWAIRHVGLACFMASFTTAVGFASLVVAKVQTIQSMGIDTAIGVMIAFLSTITLVPLLASTQLSDGLLASRSNENSLAAGVRAVTRMVSGVASWPKTVAFTGTVVTLLLGAVATNLRPDNRLTETLPTDSEAYQTMARCDESFGGVLMLHVVIDWPENIRVSSPEMISVLHDVHELLGEKAPRGENGEPLLRSPLSILNVVQAFPGRVDRNARLSLIIQHIPGMNIFVPPTLVQRFIREDLRRAIVSAHIRDIGAQVYQPIFRGLEQKLDELEEKYPGFRLGLTGTTVVASLKVQDMILSLNSGLITAGIIIFATMALAFRSALLGSLCVIPNIFPLACVAAILVWFDQPLQMATVIVFNVGIGMTVDNTIHFVTRFKHEYVVDGNTRLSIERSVKAIGAAILSTVVVLLAGFGSLMISSIPVTRLFSILVCAILATALIGDLVLLPAFLGTFVRSRKKTLPPAEGSEPTPGSTDGAVAPAAEVEAEVARGER